MLWSYILFIQNVMNNHISQQIQDAARYYHENGTDFMITSYHKFTDCQVRNLT